MFKKNESLQLASYRICPCIANIEIFSVTVTELDFVFYKKTVRDISKYFKNHLPLKILFALLYCMYSYF